MGTVACLLLEDGGYLLQEDSGKLAIEPLQYLLAAAHGTYTVTGQTATVAKNRTFDVAAGAYSITGQSATISFSRVLFADYGAYAVAGQPATISKNRILDAETGQYDTTGQSADISIGGASTVGLQRYIELRSFTERRRF